VDNVRSKCFGLLALLLTAAPIQVLRADDTYFLSGAEASRSEYYTYLGLIVPGPARENGRGFFQRYWLDRFGYEYIGGPGKVSADVWGGEAALGYGAPTTGGWWSVSVGLRHTDTDLSPDDPEATARGAQTSAKLQIELTQQLATDWRLATIASYTAKQSQYWGRVRLTRQMRPAWRFGAEAIVNGNDESESTAAGMVMVWQPQGSSWTWGLKAGYRFQDYKDSPFAGFELGNAF
jgi:hypothetical protein